MEVAAAPIWELSALAAARLGHQNEVAFLQVARITPASVAQASLNIVEDAGTAVDQPLPATAGNNTM